MSLTECKFQDAVIGSSPMMLLVALQLAKEGRHVCVIDRDHQLGGAWKTASTAMASDVEIACHLVEAFPGVYDYLATASGMPFIELDVQPVRIHRTGFHIGYHNRLMLILSGVRLLAGYCLSSLLQYIPGFHNADLHLNFKNKLSSFASHQASTIFRDSPRMQGPQFGFVEFMNQLILRCLEAGVAFRSIDVKSVTKSDCRWCVKSEFPREDLLVDSVHCTTSTNLKRNTNGEYYAVDRTEENRAAVVVMIRRTDLVINQTYAAFWKDRFVTRISRIDRPVVGDHQEFLVELRNPEVLQKSRLASIVRSRCCKAKIVSDSRKVAIVGSVCCVATRNTDQLARGEVDPGFHCYYSKGNLAAGIASWLKDRQSKLPITQSRENKCNSRQPVAA